MTKNYSDIHKSSLGAGADTPMESNYFIHYVKSPYFIPKVCSGSRLPVFWCRGFGGVSPCVCSCLKIVKVSTGSSFIQTMMTQVINITYHVSGL